MKKITTMVGAVVAIIVLTGTTYGLALRSTVEQAVTENAPMRGLILKVSKDLQAERLKLARSRAKLREFPRRQKQWDAKLTSIETQISSTKEQIAAGLSWRLIRPPLILRGDYTQQFEEDVAELGGAFSAGLETGLF